MTSGFAPSSTAGVAVMESRFVGVAAFAMESRLRISRTSAAEASAHSNPSRALVVQATRGRTGPIH